jgi:hypothetical protein
MTVTHVLTESAEHVLMTAFVCGLRVLREYVRDRRP